MTTSHPITPRELPCPTCGYDLRAATTRCPECGTEIRPGLVVSRIPWVHRRSRGAIKAYLATLLLIMITPWKLAREAHNPGLRTPAVHFHHVSVFLSTLIVATWGAMTMLRINWWHYWGDSFEYDLHNSPWLAARCMAVLIGEPWELGAVVLAQYLVARCSLACLRFLVSAFSGSRHERLRIHDLSYYLSGVAVIHAAIVAPLVVLDMCVRSELGGWFGDEWPRWAVALFWSLLLLAIVAFIWPTLFFVARTGKRHWLRAGTLLVVFPAVHIFVWLATTTIVFVAVGYLLIAIGSMVH